MKTLNFKPGTWNLRCAAVALILIACNDCTAQIQQAWVAHYNNGILNGTNQAVKMALDSSGNIYITGFSQNSDTNLGYVTIKYAPNGTQLWATRYDSTNYPKAAPAGFDLDNSNNVVVTGSALTVKYDSKGNQLWTAPYAGDSVAVDTNGNVAVTGFDTIFSTVKISPSGTNLWMETYPAACGAANGQAIVADTNGNFYVAGNYPFFCEDGIVDDELLIIKYGATGNQMWTANYQVAGTPVEVRPVSLDGAANLYILASFEGLSAEYQSFKYSHTGSLIWTVSPNLNGSSQGNAIALDADTNVLLTGRCFAYDNQTPAYGYGTFKLDSQGTELWTNYFPKTPLGSSNATSIGVDAANNSYVTGYSPGINSVNDIVTIKYDHNGNQVWLQRYTSPGNGNAAGNAIAVDNNGNVYVTGYDTTAAGGTEIVTIKYSPVVLQRRSDGTVLLQAQGSPGEAFDIEASQDLLNWLNLGSVLTDSNGLMQFDDTNAPAYPFRFYSTTPQ